jgi:hypothetical protein
MVPHPTESTVLEWLDTFQGRSKQFAFGVGLCDMKVIERRTEPIERRANTQGLTQAGSRHTPTSTNHGHNPRQTKKSPMMAMLQ